MNKRTVRAVMGALLSVAATVAVAAEPRPSESTWGPEIGSEIPTIAAADQAGITRTFADLVGPNGLILAFVRSADW